jgi:hypothetical protein|tara:strand:- start:62 stop:442 length:381 start_codon:yes stop_codon:yes gene_type:complete
MNEKIINKDGTVTVVGDAGSVADIISKKGKENAVEVTLEELKTHPWRLPKCKEEKLEDIRNKRNAKLKELDEEANQALTGRPGMRSLEAIEAHRQKLRDLPPIVEKIISKLNNTDDIEACSPKELK